MTPAGSSAPLAAKQADTGRFLDENAAWVIDGNYTKLHFARRMEEADRIVVLAFGRWTCLVRVVRRWLRWRGRTRASAAAGCPEKIDAEFIRWVLHDGRTRGKRFLVQRCVPPLAWQGDGAAQPARAGPLL